MNIKVSYKTLKDLQK